MSADDASAPPLAFSGQRLGWADLPRAVRNRISSLAGARVTAESSANSGFSPGFAAILELTDGRGVFVKAVSPEQNPESPDLARAEIRVAAALPPQVPAPRLYWWHDDGEWVILGFEVAHGRPPEVPWRPDELRLVLDALIPLADAEPLPGHDLPRTDVKLANDFTGWRRLQQRPADEIDVLVAGSGDVGAWAQSNIDRLILWEEDSLRVCLCPTGFRRSGEVCLAIRRASCRSRSVALQAGAICGQRPEGCASCAGLGFAFGPRPCAYRYIVRTCNQLDRADAPESSAEFERSRNASPGVGNT